MGSVISKVPVVGNTAANTLFGKEDPGQAASLVNTLSPEAQALSKQAMEQFGSYLGKGGDQLVANQIASQQSAARQAAIDSEEQAKRLVAQRGLGNTSLGINAILNQKQGLNEKLGAIGASAPELAQKNLAFAAQGIGNLMGAQNAGMVYNRAQPGMGRQGGLSTILGGLAGGMLTKSAGGMQAGMGLGRALGQV